MRTPRIVVALVVLALSACSTTTVGSATAAPEVPLPAGVEPVTISAAAAGEFGRGAVGVAYAVATAMTSTYSFQEPLLRKRITAVGRDDFAAIAEYLTPELATRYLDDVRKGLAGDGSADADVTSLQLYSVAAPGVEMTAAPALSGYTVTNATADMTTASSTRVVELRLTERAQLSVVENGVPGSSALVKKLVLRMVPATGAAHPWLVTGYTATLSIGAIAPR